MICYVDFSSDLRTTLCGDPVGAAELDAGKRVTLYMSSATCPHCIERIQARLAQLSLGTDNAFSSSARI